MRRSAEAGLLAGAALIASLGVVLVDFGKAGQIGWTPLLLVLVYAGALAGVWMAVRYWVPQSSPLLLPPAALLVALGFVEIYRIDSGQGSVQLWWVLVGLAGAIGVVAVYRQKVERLMSFGYPLAILGWCLMVLPVLPRLFTDSSTAGSGLWLEIGEADNRFLIQPFGMGMMLLAVGLSGVYCRWTLGGPAPGWFPPWLTERRPLFLLVAVWAAILPLLWATGDITAWVTAMALATSVASLATGQRRVVWSGVALLSVGVGLGQSSPRVRATIEAWLDPFSSDASGMGLGESLLAMGSGHLSGSGLGMGDPGLIPRASTDWIMAALAEELGLAGTVAVIALFALLVAVGMGVALGSRDLFSKVTAGSVSALLGLTFLGSAGGLERLVPPTGMGMPFLAHGGFPLLMGWLVIGLLVTISDQERGLW